MAQGAGVSAEAGGKDASVRRLVRKVARALRPAALRKARGRLSRRAQRGVRHAWLRSLKVVRAIPLVRDRVIPSLINYDLAQVPAAPAVSALHHELRRLQQTSGPILVGPWIGEVGFELLYWIPFLNWALKEYGLDQRRLIAVSRGGASPWYRHLTSEYVDVFELFSLEEYRHANDVRWSRAGHQKQQRVDQMDLDIAERARLRLGLGQMELLHPWLMYKLLRLYWFEKAGAGLLTRHTDYRPLASRTRSAALKDLPAEYVAVRFYFRPSFPDTPENRRFAADIIRTISKETAVVLLNTGLSLDDHEDLALSGPGVHTVDHLMTLERNLEIQTEIISQASAFVGTYGGLSYLAPFYGVPSISFYSTEAELIPAHIEVSWRLGRAMDVRVAALHTGAADLLRMVLGGTPVHAAVPAGPR